MRCFLPISIAAALVILAVACEGGEEAPAATPSPSASPTAHTTAHTPSPTGSPSPAASPTPTMRPEAAARQLTYIGTDGAIWLVNADGTGRTRLADAPQCTYMVWSPGGHRIGCEHAGVIVDAETGRVIEVQLPENISQSIWWSPRGDLILHLIQEGPYEPGEPRWRLILGDDSGQLLKDLGRIGIVPRGGLQPWSPDGRFFAYWSRDAQQLRIYSVDDGEERALGGGHRPMAWALGGQALIVADEYDVDWSGDPYPIFSYEANLLDLASGQLARLPELDRRQLWVSPDGNIAAVVVPAWRILIRGSAFWT